MTEHRTGTREEWLAARRELLDAEKRHMREGDELARRRQELPWVAIEKEYVFDTDDGKKTLEELFDGRSQLLVYHFMFGFGFRVDEQNPGCTGCSFVADHFDGVVPHLNGHDVTLVSESIAPLEELHPYKKRMGWQFPWVSSLGSDFKYDFGAAFTEEQQRGGAEYNFRHVEGPPPQREGMRLPVSTPGAKLVWGAGAVAPAALPSSASRSALRAAFGDGGVRRRCGGGCVGDRGSPSLLSGGCGLGGDEALQRGVPGGVVDVVVLPQSPEHAAPGAAEDPDRVRVRGAAFCGALVDVGGPGVVVSAAVGESGDRVSEPVVAGPAEAGAFGLAGLDGDGGLAAIGRQGLVGWVARAAVAHLGEHGRGGDDALGVLEQGPEGVAVGVIVQRSTDLAGQLADTRHERLERGDQRQHDLPARLGLQLARSALGGAPEPVQQLLWAATAAVAVTRQEAGHSVLAERARVSRGRVLLEERQRDRAVDLGEHLDRAGPKQPS